jgi:methionyl-tRNA formyltransferase
MAPLPRAPRFDKMMKLAILTSNRFGLASDCLAALHDSDRCRVVGVILCCSVQASRQRALWKTLKKIKRVGVLGVLTGMYMRRFFDKHRTEEIETLCRRLGVPFVLSRFTNSEETAGLLRRFEPDLGLSLGNGYIAQRIFELPRYGMVNVHLERLPRYRNGRSIIWPIYFLEEDTGFTIHKVDSRIDGGDILYQETQPIIFCPSLGQTITKTIDAVMRRAPIGVRNLCDDYTRFAAAAQPQENGSEFTTPTLPQFFRMVRNNRLLYQRKSQIVTPAAETR